MKKCEIEIGEKTYSLYLTRSSVKDIESKGFNLQDFADKPITMIDLLWYGGFIANHRDVNPTLSQKLFEQYEEEGGDTMEVINFLAESYTNFVSAPADTKLKKKAKITEA